MLAFVVAFLIAIFGIFYFVHPVLVLTLKDIFTIAFVDAIIAFLLALYLTKDDSKNSLIIWTIVGVLIPPITIIAAIIKYNKQKAKS